MNETMVKVMSDYGAIAIAMILMGLCIWLLNILLDSRPKIGKGLRV